MSVVFHRRQPAMRPLVQPSSVSVADADDAVLAELQLELAALKQALDRSKEDADRLRGLWPRAELQRLHLALAEQVAVNEDLSRHYGALSASTVGRLSAPMFRVLERLRPAVRAVRLGLRAAGYVRRFPARVALLRQRRADLAVLAGSPLFDRDWYRGQALPGDTATDPVGHYLWLGHAAGHDPHTLFDGAWYAARHPGLGLANPFADYLRRGMAADEDPHPLFDAALYIAQAPGAAGRALAHYAARRREDGRSPAPLFDVAGYAADNPDAGADPLAHYVRTGAAEDRDPHALFDAAWYRARHLAGEPGANPLAHWVREGRQRGLTPNPFGLDPATLPRLASHAAPVVSVLVQPSRRSLGTARSLLAVAQHSGDVAVEVVLAAGEGPAWLPGLRLLPGDEAPHPLGRANAAARRAQGRFLVFLDSEAVVHPGWLEPMVALAEADAAVAMVGAQVRDREGRLLDGGGMVAGDGQLTFPGAGEDAAHPSHAFARPVATVSFTAVLVRRDAWCEVGGFDEAFAAPGMAVADLAQALLRRGWRVLHQPASVVTAPHFDTSAAAADQARFCERWAAPLSARHAPRRNVLVLADGVPASGDEPAARALNLLLRQGAAATLHPAATPLPSDAARWERRGVAVLRSPILFGDWLADAGPALDEVWSFRAPPDVPVAALLAQTGAGLRHWSPDGVRPAWCDALLTPADLA